MAKKSIKISACAIMKNEESNFRQWFENIRTIADEIIVVDTGSSDGTRELARAAGVKLYEFAWCNDFSAAKNYALDQAHGDWIIFIDADEYFSAEAQKKMRPTLQRLHPQRRIAGIITPYVNIDVDQGGKLLTQTVVMRVFRREPTLRFRGMVHEHIANLAPPGHDREFRVTDLALYHTGYSRSVFQDKCRRNLAMLKDEAAQQGGEQPGQYGYFCDAYMGLEDYSQAAHYARLALEAQGQPGMPVGQEGKLATQLLDALRLSGASDEEYLSNLTEMQQKLPRLPELWLHRGLFELENLKDYQSAEASLWQVLALVQEKRQGSVQASNIESRLPLVYTCLARLLHMQGRDEESVACLQQALLLAPAWEQALRLLCQVLKYQEQALLDILQPIYTSRQGASFLLNILKDFPPGRAYTYYAGIARRTGSWEYYTATGDDAAALKVLES